MQEIAPRIVFWVLGIPVTDSVTTTWVVMGIIFVFSWILARSLSEYPSKIQSLFETLIEFYDNIAVQVMGEKGKQ
ncbi:MAG: hypothetical protein ACP5JL_06600, partial [bacterium]